MRGIGTGITYKGGWKEGVRHGQGEVTFPGTGQSYKGEFYAGFRHGIGTTSSSRTGISFEGRFQEGRIKGHGSLVWRDVKTKREKRRVARGMWVDRNSSSFNVRNLADMVDEEGMQETENRARQYVKDHGILLGVMLDEWMKDVKQRLREERKQEKLEKEQEERQKIIDRRETIKQMRAQALEEKEEEEKAENE